MYRKHPGSCTFTEILLYTDWINFRRARGFDLRVFEDAITFKIALMVVKYMKYMESLEY